MRKTRDMNLGFMMKANWRICNEIHQVLNNIIKIQYNENIQFYGSYICKIIMNERQTDNKLGHWYFFNGKIIPLISTQQSNPNRIFSGKTDTTV
jgi:hypothetical protein